MEPQTIIPFERLTDAEVDQGRAALAQHVGDAATEVQWLRRLGRGPDGAWLLRVRSPAVPLADLDWKHRDRPWLSCHPGVFDVVHRWHSLDEAVGILMAPSNSDLECERRLSLKRAHDAEEKAIYGAEQARIEERSRAEAAARREAEERYQKFDGAGWDRLPREVRVVYRMALALEGDNPGAALRALAIEMQGREIRFPGVRWS